MIVITIAAIVGLIIALGGCLNKIADMKWDIELIEAHNRELERLLQQMEQETLEKKQFGAYNLKIEETA